MNVVGMLSGTDATFIGPITLADSQFALLQFAGAKIARADGRGRALEAHNITVGMHVIVREGAELDGALWLNHANIGGNLDLSGCTIRNPGKRALSADLAKIKGDVFLRNQQEGETRIAAKLIASVSLTSADIGGSLFVDQVIIGEEAANTYINFNRLKIAGVMRCVDATLTASTVSLANSRIGMLADDIVSWPDGRLILNGCEYGLLSGDAPTRWRDRLGWLRKQKYEHLYVHPRPQPFSQLVSVLRRMGHERDARAIAIARRRLETAAVPWYSPRRLGGYLLDLTSGYGYRPWLALIWMVLFAGFGYGVFTHGKGSFSIAAEVKALSLCHAYSFPRKLCVRLMSLHGARASLRGRRG
ncbi:MAG: hypothetical protein ACJ8CH_14825, partial [Microvirga sp.]